MFTFVSNVNNEIANKIIIDLNQFIVSIRGYFLDSPFHSTLERNPQFWNGMYEFLVDLILDLVFRIGNYPPAPNSIAQKEKQTMKQNRIKDIFNCELRFYSKNKTHIGLSVFSHFTTCHLFFVHFIWPLSYLSIEMDNLVVIHVTLFFFSVVFWNSMRWPHKIWAYPFLVSRQQITNITHKYFISSGFSA